MQPISQTEINGKISRALLSRSQHGLTPAQQLRIADLVGQFDRAVKQRDRRDSETLAGLVRALSKPRGADAERFVELLRGIVRQELASKRN
jgi:hypothetical protein